MTYLVVHKKFWTFEIPRCDADIVLLSWVVELSKSPVDETEFSILMINHHIVRLHISMHDPLAMTVIQCLQTRK